jgi:hypothetical protein
MLATPKRHEGGSPPICLLPYFMKALTSAAILSALVSSAKHDASPLFNVPISTLFWKDDQCVAVRVKLESPMRVPQTQSIFNARSQPQLVTRHQSLACQALVPRLRDEGWSLPVTSA